MRVLGSLFRKDVQLRPDALGTDCHVFPSHSVDTESIRWHVLNANHLLNLFNQVLMRLYLLIQCINLSLLL